MARAKVAIEVDSSEIGTGVEYGGQQSEPQLFAECRSKYGSNMDMWPIWVRDEYQKWTEGGSAPEGGLPDEYHGGMKKAEEQTV